MTETPGMAIIASVFPPNERGRAIGLMMVVVGLSSSIGPSVGGIVVDAFGWRYVFYLSIPLVLLGIASAAAVPEESRSTGKPQDSIFAFDWLGAGLSSLALIMLLVAMTNSHRFGWGSPIIMLAMLSFFVLLGSFVWWELRTSNPTLDLRFFGRRTFSFGVSAVFLSFLGTSATFVLTPFYLQSVLGFSAATSGFTMISSAISLTLGGLISGVLSDRYGWRPFTVGGLAVCATGVFLFSRLTDQSPLVMVIAALFLTNVGSGTFYSPNASSVLGSVGTASYGIVSGLLNLMRNGAGIISLAMATAIITATMGSPLGFEPSLNAVQETTGAGVGHAFTLGLRNAYIVMLVLLLIGMTMSVVQGERVSQVESAAPTGDGFWVKLEALNNPANATTNLKIPNNAYWLVRHAWFDKLTMSGFGAFAHPESL